MKNTFTLLMLAFTCHLSTFASPNFAELRSNLYIVSPSGEPVLMDGALTQYDTNYSNNMDGLDARKMSNFSENWGMLRGATTYVIERRQSISGTDSIFFKMWNMRIITYRIELIAKNLESPGMTGILEDNFLHIQTPVNLNSSTFINFSVTSDPASKAANRFRIIFSKQAAAGILPLTFTYTKVFQRDNSLNVNFKTANERNVKQYDIERSADGIQFYNIARIDAGNNAINNYNWTDANPLAGNNFYRVKSMDIDGKSQYSDVMKGYSARGSVGLNVYPNPVKNNQLNLQMIYQQKGIYEVRLLNSFGQSFFNKTINHKGGSNVEKLMPSQNIPKGIYRLEVIQPDGNRQVISVIF